MTVSRHSEKSQFMFVKDNICGILRRLHGFRFLAATFVVDSTTAFGVV